MGSHGDDHIYLLGRSEAETTRLNNQHRFLVAISGDIIHPSIPIDTITAVADVGTGTGIWLADLAKRLPNAQSVYLHGFDISDAQFPPDHTISGPQGRKIPLSVQDGLKPFPPEHLGRYDLVHIRLLTAGLLQDGYATVLKNARDLLTPNGWIQWEEVDHTTFCTDKLPEHPAITKLRNATIDAMLKIGMWPFAPQRVFDEISKAQFQNVRRETYTTVGKEHLHEIAPKWVANVMRALVPPSMVVNGQARNEEEAKAKVEVLIRQFEEHCEGALPLVNLGVTVAQRCE
ncbi:Methyltransferase type 12 [Penicillium maclennaniae]|uniref:Methyltransferase type 12 n=1 Tax=Penicillium maclennaniae TaxID=1343394 RepID=UPI00253FA662|nr:Methyltransferase type 12 [Penicillium maclennaniae]KAJ5661902.1 Methyltransferase type 12 [Penicillium maclennaniae]